MGTTTTKHYTLEQYEAEMGRIADIYAAEARALQTNFHDALEAARQRAHRAKLPAHRVSMTMRAASERILDALGGGNAE